MSSSNPIVRVPTVPLGLTMFALIALLGSSAGSIIGYLAGSRYFGITGGIVGALPGGIIGLILGYLPQYFTNEWTFRKMQKSSNEELKVIVNSSLWTFNQTLALLNLQLRGENVESYLPRVITLLESKDLRSRYFARDALALVFTPLAKKMGVFDPGAPEEVRRRQIASLREAISLHEN